MAKGQNYRQKILAAVEEMNAWDKEVHLNSLTMDTGLTVQQVSGAINLMRHKGYPVSVVRIEGRKHVSWKFQNHAKWTEKVVTDAKAKGEAFKAVKVTDDTTNQIAVVNHLEAAGFGQEVPIADIVAGTGLKVAAIKKVVEQIRLEKGGRIEVIKPGLYKLHEHVVVKTARQVRNEARDKARQAAGALKQVHKGTNFFTQAEAGYASVRDAANAIRGTDADEVMRAAKGYTDEDLEYGRRVLQNFDRLPQEVKDKIEVLKEVAPEFTEDLENVLVKVLGVPSVQDADPSFWAVDQFTDGALMLARKDGTHWKATKL